MQVQAMVQLGRLPGHQNLRFQLCGETKLVHFSSGIDVLWYAKTQTIQERGAIGFCSPGTAASLPILTMTVLYPGLLCACRAASAVGYGSELISPDQTFSISSLFMVLGRLRLDCDTCTKAGVRVHYKPC